VPESLTNLANLEIRSINQLKDSLLWNNCNHLLQQIDIDERAGSGASNLVRYMVLKKMGGMYRDLDYQIFDAEKLWQYMQAYNFLGGKEDEKEFAYIGNSFLACIPNHPIIDTEIEQIDRNLNTNSSLLPQYLQYPCAKFSDRMYKTGPASITISFYKSANKDGNVDLLAIPHNVFS